MPRLSHHAPKRQRFDPRVLKDQEDARLECGQAGGRSKPFTPCSPNASSTPQETHERESRVLHADFSWLLASDRSAPCQRWFD